jgi:hypothetical protein
MARPVYMLRVRPEPGVVDAIRALRGWLKLGLRTFGLRCVSIEEVKHKEVHDMDMRRFSSGYIKPDDVRDGAIQAHIINITVSEKYNRPVLELDSGQQFTVNATNNGVLCKAYGYDSTGWLGHLIELSFGMTKYDGKDIETVVLTAISSRDSNGSNGTPARMPQDQLPPPLPKKTIADDMDDSVPF